MIEQINGAVFNEKIIDSDGVIVVKVYTDACPNCKTLTPFYEKANAEKSDGYHFYDLKAQDGMDWVRKYKVLGVPTLLFFRKGLLLDKKTGVISSEKILRRLDKIAALDESKLTKKEVTGFFKMPWK